jgi:hypothetical protein
MASEESRKRTFEGTNCDPRNNFFNFLGRK